MKYAKMFFKKSKSHSLISFRHADTRALILVTIAVVVLIAYLLVASFYSSLNHSKNEVLNRLRAVAFTSAYLIDGDKHHSVEQKYLLKNEIKSSQSDPDYFQMHQTLQMVQRANNLKTPIYTIVFHPLDSTFRFIVTSGESPYYRHVYKKYPMELLSNYETGGILDTYEDENGIWLSAFAPIRNSEGNVIALLQADESFSEFVVNERNALLKNLLIALVFVVPFVFALIRFLAITLDKRQQAHEILQEKNEEIRVQNEMIIKNQVEVEKANQRISEQNELLELRVAERTNELQKSNEELSQFLYHSSHDVQAPVATLKGLLYLLSQEKELNSGQIIDRINNTLEQMSRMLKTLQAIHRVKTKICETTNTNIEELIQEVQHKLEPYRPAELLVEYSFKITYWLTDKELLELILTEITRNCFQYGHFESDAHIRFSSEIVDNNLLLEIADNGPGISQQVQNNLFGMFIRADERSTGMGMGLRIAKIGVDRMGGSIQITTEQIGCRILVRLPALQV